VTQRQAKVERQRQRACQQHMEASLCQNVAEVQRQQALKEVQRRQFASVLCLKDAERLQQEALQRHWAAEWKRQDNEWQRLETIRQQAAAEQLRLSTETQQLKALELRLCCELQWLEADCQRHEGSTLRCSQELQRRQHEEALCRRRTGAAAACAWKARLHAQASSSSSLPQKLISQDVHIFIRTSVRYLNPPLRMSGAARALNCKEPHCAAWRCWRPECCTVQGGLAAIHCG
jgi:hypothetical protein